MLIEVFASLLTPALSLPCLTGVLTAVCHSPLTSHNSGLVYAAVVNYQAPPKTSMVGGMGAIWLPLNLVL